MTRQSFCATLSARAYFVRPFSCPKRGVMSAPARSIPAHLVTDLKGALARLRTSRLLDSDHAEVFDNNWHPKCEVCRNQRRFQWLCDQLPGKAST